MIELLPHAVISRVNGGYVVQFTRYIQGLMEEGSTAEAFGECVFAEGKESEMMDRILEHVLRCGKPYEDGEEDSDDSSDSVNDALRQRPTD